MLYILRCHPIGKYYYMPHYTLAYYEIQLEQNFLNDLLCQVIGAL
jgi:hypothetical protein